MVEEDDIVVDADEVVRLGLFIARSSVVVVRLIPVLFPSPLDVVREDDDFFFEEEFLLLEEDFVEVEDHDIVLEALVILLEEDFIVRQASVMCRPALGNFLFDHDVVVEDDEVFVEDNEGWLEQVDGYLEQVDMCLEENAGAVEAKFKCLSVERGRLGESVNLSTLPARRDT